MAQNNTRTPAQELREIFLNGLLYKNPVLVGAIGLCPVVAAGTTLKNGLCLSIILFVLMIPTCLLFSLMGDKLPAFLRPPAVLLLSGVLYIPASMLCEAWLPGTTALLGIYAPLMIANAIISSRAIGFSVKHIYYASLIDSLSCALGFALVIIAASCIRELAIYGTVWNTPPVSASGTDVTKYVFVGFIVLGFFSAIAQGARNHRDNRRQKKGETRE